LSERPYFLDTNIVSDLLRNPRGRTASAILTAGEDNICISAIVASELRYGVAKSGSTRIANMVEELLREVPILAYEPPADRHYGRIRAELEVRGELIGGNDMLIAAQALAHDLILVTDNVREFGRISELTIENWLR
jgi:tRNA(fMet)-specific endonuclease VapC